MFSQIAAASVVTGSASIIREACTMLCPNYFLITPRPVLVDRLTTFGGEELADLRARVMWSDLEYDRGLLHRADFELLVKLLFLDTLKREREDGQAFSQVFPDLSINAGYFDSLWEFERFGIESTVNDAISDAIASGTLHSVMEHANDRLRQALAREARPQSNNFE